MRMSALSIYKSTTNGEHESVRELCVLDLICIFDFTSGKRVDNVHTSHINKHNTPA